MLEVLVLETNCWDDNFWKYILLFGESKKVCELDFEELGIVFLGRRDSIVSYNNALFLQRESNPADLVEPLFGNRCSIIRSDLRHCSTFTCFLLEYLCGYLLVDSLKQIWCFSRAGVCKSIKSWFRQKLYPRCLVQGRVGLKVCFHNRLRVFSLAKQNLVWY